MLLLTPGRDEGVERIGLPATGPFEPELVRADQPGPLLYWLDAYGYLITPEMEPAVADYVAADMWFLALKLAPGAGVSDIRPISMTYEADEPMVPLQLTGVAAKPEMGVIVFVAGPSRYEASAVPDLEIPVEMLQAGPVARTRAVVRPRWGTGASAPRGPWRGGSRRRPRWLEA